MGSRCIIWVVATLLAGALGCTGGIMGERGGPGPDPDPADPRDPADPPVMPPPGYDCTTAADSDADGITDVIEGTFDTDLDGTDDAHDTDSDGDGLSDAEEVGDADPCTPPRDSDADGSLDHLDPDQDDDGLADGAEAMHGTDLHVADSDGDGFVDGVEVLAGSSPTDASSVIPPEDFYVILPFMDPAQHRELSFRARLGRADVFFLVDTTGSMGGAITNVQSSLSTTIVPAIAEVIADARMGVGDFRDFPRDSYGSPGDWEFLLRQAVTDSVPAVQSALSALSPGGGADWPESGVEAIWHSVSAGCSTGAGRGAACFRGDATPIIVHITDAPTHNGPGGSNAYHFGGRTFDEATAAVRAIGAKILGVNVSGGRGDLEALARATDSIGSSGGILVYDAPGGTVDRAVVDGIAELAGGIPQDVTTERRDDPADSVDATRFMRAVRPVRSSSPSVTMDDTTFYRVPGGAEVTFDVEFVNDFVEHGPRAQIFHAELDVVDAPTRAPLDTRNVYVIVPAASGSIIF